MICWRRWRMQRGSLTRSDRARLMNFLVDAQLPRRLAQLLTAAGHDAVHTRDLPDGNRTTDSALRAICRQQRILGTKDADFTTSFLLQRDPARLWLISTGNITNRELEALVRVHLPALMNAFDSSAFVELDRLGISVRA